MFGDREPSAAAIGAVLDGAPAYIALYDAHSAIASPAAMALAGLTGPRGFTSSASVVCDAEAPTGYLLEAEAMDLVADLIPEEDLDSVVVRARAQLLAMAAAGLTGLHAMDFRDPARGDGAPRGGGRPAAADHLP